MPVSNILRRYVMACLVLAAAVLLWSQPHGMPDISTMMVAFAVGCFIEVSRTHNKEKNMAGSLAFVVHLAMGLVLGGFWGAIMSGAGKLMAELYGRTELIKAVFNVSERVISVGLAFGVYGLLGGKIPPDILVSATEMPLLAILVDLAQFLAATLIYFLCNSLLVVTAIALASGRPILGTWRRNTSWVIGYDLAASFLALAAAWLFVFSAENAGLLKLLPLMIVVPFAVAKHLYGKLNTLQDRNKELDEAYAELELNIREQLEMMVKAIEARDPYTSGHSRRVCGLSREIAIAAGLSEKDVEDIENAALLHDVGKIHAEFAAILQKEGRLTDEERAIINTHPIKSAELVAGFSRFRGYVVDCVRHHHERWDGMGYPDGLKAEEIPLGARIITIADTIDAMTTDRPYRLALKLDVVIAELNKGRNSQYDDALVDVTVNSFSVRRLISNPASIPELIPSHRRTRKAEQSHPLLPRRRSSGDS